MTELLMWVAVMAVVSWLTLIAASLISTRAWSLRGLQRSMGNRDQLPEPAGLAGRAARTARNTLENFVLFAALALTAHASGATSPWVLFGAQVFVGARLVFIAVYYAGVPYLRTGVWLVSVVGLGLMLCGLF